MKENPIVPKITARVGQTLRDIQLPMGWKWDDVLGTVISGHGGELFTVSYPGDDRFNAVHNAPITISYL